MLLILCLSVSNEAQNWYSAFHADSLLPQLFSYAGAIGFGVSTALIGHLLILSGLPQSLLAMPFQSFFGLLMLFACLAAFFITVRNGDSGSSSLAPLLPALPAASGWYSPITATPPIPLCWPSPGSSWR